MDITREYIFGSVILKTCKVILLLYLVLIRPLLAHPT